MRPLTFVFKPFSHYSITIAEFDAIYSEKLTTSLSRIKINRKYINKNYHVIFYYRYLNGYKSKLTLVKYVIYKGSSCKQIAV
jgi:hypothetical protein